MKISQSPYLTIAEFSRLTHTPIDTLKYYDRIGLLKPAHTGANQYRYYLPEQSLLLTRILFDTRAKIPLRDIKKSLAEMDAEAMMRHYERIRAETETSVEEFRAMQGTINNMRYYYELSRKHPPKTLFQMYLPEWFLIKSRKLDFSAAPESSEPDIANQLFLKGFYNGRWPHYLLGACFETEDLDAPTLTETSYFLKVDHPEEFPKEEIHFIRGGAWLCMLMSVAGKGLVSILREYKTQLARAECRIESPVLVMDVVNRFLTTDPARFCTMVYALIKEK